MAKPHRTTTCHVNVTGGDATRLVIGFGKDAMPMLPGLTEKEVEEILDGKACLAQQSADGELAVIRLSEVNAQPPLAKGTLSVLESLVAYKGWPSPGPSNGGWHCGGEAATQRKCEYLVRLGLAEVAIRSRAAFLSRFHPTAFTQYAIFRSKEAHRAAAKK